MKVVDVEIRACRGVAADPDSTGLVTGTSRHDFVVVTVRTDDGLTGTSFGFGGTDAQVTAAAMSPVKQFLLGKDPLARSRLWHDFRRFDRWWNHTPIYAYGPFDIACWDIAGKVAGQPLYRLLGEFRDRVPVYGSSMLLDTVESYVGQAEEVQRAGWHAYKLHPPGDVDFDLEVYSAVRAAVGPSFKLMADPVAAYSFNDALRIGRVLESLDYYWFEEPLFDSDRRGLKVLSSQLDIPVAGTEVLPGAQYSTADYISDAVVGIVRSDVSWRGGVTGLMRTASVAEAFGVQCEVHTAIYHALDIVNLHCCCAMPNSEFFELLYPIEEFGMGITTGIEIDGDGFAHPPVAPGIGVSFDWDHIDNQTAAIL